MLLNWKFLMKLWLKLSYGDELSKSNLIKATSSISVVKKDKGLPLELSDFF
jgi:hypothetical protein